METETQLEVINLEELANEIRNILKDSSTIVELINSGGGNATIYLYEKNPQLFFAIGWGHYATMRVEIADLCWGIDGEEPVKYAINEPLYSIKHFAFTIVSDYLQVKESK